MPSSFIQSVSIDQGGVFEAAAPQASPVEDEPQVRRPWWSATRLRCACSSTGDEAPRTGALDPREVDGDEWRRGPETEVSLTDAVDLALGAGVAATAVAARVARPLVAAAAAGVRLGIRASRGRGPGRAAAQLAERGERFREGLVRAAAEAVRWLLPRAVERALTTVDVTDLVRDHVDLDALAKILDVDAVVARVDLDAAVSRVDIDAVVSRVDLDGIAGRLDLDAIIDRADLDRAVSRVDLGAIMRRVDPDEVVARVDIEAALARMDLAAIARQVIEEIDLAGIIRESAGVVSSQAARAVRTEGMNADDSVARFVDRVLRRPHPGGAVTP
jgi:hypothetical protein